MKGEEGRSRENAGGRLRAGSGLQPSGHSGFLTCGMLGAQSGRGSSIRSRPNPNLGSELSWALLQLLGRKTRLPAAAGRCLGGCKPCTRSSHLEPGGGRGAGARDGPCLRDLRPRAAASAWEQRLVAAAPCGLRAGRDCGRGNVKKAWAPGGSQVSTLLSSPRFRAVHEGRCG